MNRRICHPTRAKVVRSVMLLSFLAIASLGQTTADDWRQSPRPPMPAKADDVPRMVRTRRNKFFDRVYGPPPKGWVSEGPDIAPIFEEIPAWGDLTIALAQFTDSRTIVSTSKRTIYIEARMNVEQVLRDPSGTARPNHPVTIGIAGGSVMLPSGRIIQQNLRQLEVCRIQPGHRYLVFLAYENALGLFECVKGAWDLSTGVAVATDPFDVRKVKEGSSRFAGLQESQFLAAAEAILSPQKK